MSVCTTAACIAASQAAANASMMAARNARLAANRSCSATYISPRDYDDEETRSDIGDIIFFSVAIGLIIAGVVAVCLVICG